MAAAALAAAVPTRAEQPGDIAAFLLGLRDLKVHADGEARIPLNAVWGFAEAVRIGPGRYRAEHRGGILKLEATASSPERCVHRVEFVFRTASLIDNTEAWTLDLRSAELAVERKTTGAMPGVGLRVRGPKAFCFTSSLRPDGCTDSQLFDDHTPNTGEEDLARKTRELEAVVAQLKTQGCAR
jgi:hypothetical protein